MICVFQVTTDLFSVAPSFLLMCVNFDTPDLMQRLASNLKKAFFLIIPLTLYYYCFIYKQSSIGDQIFEWSLLSDTQRTRMHF